MREWVFLQAQLPAQEKNKSTSILRNSKSLTVFGYHKKLQGKKVKENKDNE